jgi:mannose-6-phosphate isomerase-like protein (cupin superfamily)
MFGSVAHPSHFRTGKHSAYRERWSTERSSKHEPRPPLAKALPTAPAQKGAPVNARPDQRSLDEATPVRAPDGSVVRPLCQIGGHGSFAHFSLERGETARAVSHATVQEIWYVIRGSGQMWRRHDTSEDTVEMRPGVCLTIPLGTTFQFRVTHDSDEDLEVVAVTMPPWPEDATREARLEHGPWTPVLRR